MRQAIVVATMMGAALFGGTFSSATQPRDRPAIQFCRPPDVYSSVALTSFAQFVTATDSFSVRARAILGVPLLQSTDVTLETSEAVCQRGRGVIDSVAGSPPSTEPIFVYRLGPAHRILDDGIPTGKSFRGGLLVDTLWVVKSGVTILTPTAVP